MKNISFLLLGILFGIVLFKSEVASWFRIQEMFRFQSFHMFGVICSAIAVGLILLQVIRYSQKDKSESTKIALPQRKFHKGIIIGGLLFGAGWAFTGACPAPIFTLIGAGNFTYIIVLLSALLGTFVYSKVKDKLPN